ncbi:MAG: hypothetical protein F6K01_10250 [Okeania sp. SIO1I7]|nr:hypothetical protein [Okeania sp. SIO1I7]
MVILISSLLKKRFSLERGCATPPKIKQQARSRGCFTQTFPGGLLRKQVPNYMHKFFG